MDLVRDPARWMVDLDDRILETLSVYDGLKIYQLHERLVREGRVEPPVAYVLLRCKRLREYDLLALDDGRFVVTETGEGYLNGDVDAALLSGVRPTVNDGHREWSGDD